MRNWMMKLLRLFFLAGVNGLLMTSGTSLAAEQPETFECMLEPHVVSEIGSHVEGIIEDIKVARGEFVEEGQVLVALKADLEKAVVELARARAESNVAIRSGKVRQKFGERKYQRSLELLQKDFVSDFDLDQANTEKQLAELALEEARENHKIAQLELQRAIEMLEIRTIRSPLQGVVVEKYQAKGERVTEQPILQLAQIDPLNVEVILPVNMLGRITTGMQGSIRTEASDQKTHTGRVVVVDDIVNAASGMFGVRLELPNPERKIPAGLRCQVTFLPEEVNQAELSD
jgi:RND family efflux transporter MFP subunit